MLNGHIKCAEKICTNLILISALEEEARQKKLKIKKEVRRFWKDVLLIMQASPPHSNLHNVAMLKYVIPNHKVPAAMDEFLERKVTSYHLLYYPTKMSNIV